MARPKSIQRPQAYLRRHQFRFADPTGLLPGQWRLISREPINKMAQRFIIRELCALRYVITSDEREDPKAEEYNDTWDEKFDDGKGFDVWLSRIIEDACTLPFGGASEIGYDGEDLAWVLHVDSATLMPTYERRLPYVQVNPDDWTKRVYFNPKQLQRLIVAPRPDIRFKEYQVSPTEDAFLAIQALSRIYLYYMQQLDDTPPPGILDVGDMTYEDAQDWAKQFRETIEGVDPIKIPLLYDHDTPAKWIPFGQTPQDLNILEQLKRFAEMLLGKYGLSIGDLRLFEHEQTKAGARVAQLVTERSGIGFWASSIETYLNRLLPKELTFQFKQPRPERELIVAQRQQTQLAVLQAATGNKNLMSPEDAVEQAKDWELFTIDWEAPEPEPVPAAFGGNGQEPDEGPTQEEIDQNEEARDAFDDADLAKKAAAIVKAELGEWKDPAPSVVDRLTSLFRMSFVRAGESVKTKTIEDALALVRENVTEGGELEEKAVLTHVVEGRMHEAFTVALDRAFQLGYLDRENRIAASSVIGDWLPTLSAELLTRVEGAGVDIKDDDLRILAKAVLKALTPDQIDEAVEKLFDRAEWWKIPLSRRSELESVLRELYAHGLNVDAGRIEKLRLGLGEVPAMAIDWNLRDPFVEKLIETQAAEMVVNVNNGTKSYLREMILEGVENGWSTIEMVDHLKSDLFGLPSGEASKFTQARLQSIVNYEVNKAMSSAGQALRTKIGLKLKQWFTNRVSPCDICLSNEAQGVVKYDFQYDGVFGAILHPPAHPQTCRCVTTAVASEVKALGEIDWPFTIKAFVEALPA